MPRGFPPQDTGPGMSKMFGALDADEKASRELNDKRKEPEEAIGTIMTQIDCPQCSNVFDLEGDCDGEIVECPDCKEPLKIRRL